MCFLRLYNIVMLDKEFCEDDRPGKFAEYTSVHTGAFLGFPEFASGVSSEKL
jgi:hypothetical protein